MITRAKCRKLSVACACLSFFKVFFILSRNFFFFVLFLLVHDAITVCRCAQFLGNCILYRMKNAGYKKLLDEGVVNKNNASKTIFAFRFSDLR